MDMVVQIWWLAWAAHAFPHVHTLFAGQGQNYPYGQNFGVNGSMVALGVFFAPVTKLFGPVVTFNILLRLAVAASAASMCFVLRRWISWWPAAFLGGLLYGFSAYMSNYGAYLFLIFVPLPPLILLFVHEIFVRQRWKARRTGIALGLLCALQFFIWVEVLAGTVLIGAIAVVLVCVVARRKLLERWRYVVTALAYAVGVAIVLLAYPLYFTFRGPQHINGPPNAPSSLAALNGDLVSPFFPSTRQWIDPSAIRGLGPSNYNAATNLLYLGLPLVLVLLCSRSFFAAERRSSSPGVWHSSHSCCPWAPLSRSTGTGPPSLFHSLSSRIYPHSAALRRDGSPSIPTSSWPPCLRSGSTRCGNDCGDDRIP